MSRRSSRSSAVESSSSSSSSLVARPLNGIGNGARANGGGEADGVVSGGEEEGAVVDGEQQQHDGEFLFRLMRNARPIRKTDDDYKMSMSEKEQTEWLALDETLQEQLVRTAVRVLLMKGGRNEMVSRSTHVGAALGAIDPRYKKFLNAVMNKAQEALLKVFGMGLINESSVLGAEPTASGKVLLFDGMNSSRLKRVLAENDQDAAFKGFVFVVTHAVWAAAGRKLPLEALLQEIRQLDPRFPVTTLTSDTGRKGGKGVTAIPELGDDFHGLMQRAKSEGYITLSKDENRAGPGGGEDVATMVGLGTRFLVEFGREVLVRSYFKAVNEEADPSAIQEVQEEENTLKRKREDQKKDKEANRKKSVGRPSGSSGVN
jgi:hypothetical protein